MGEVNTESLCGEEIVVSGISGIYPSSQNAQQFMENLYNKVDMVESSESYWDFNHPEVPKHVGRIRDLEHFDSNFFKVPNGQGSALDAMSRKLLEQAFCAIFDAGVNPMTLSGKKIGVFVGSSYSDIFALNLPMSSKYSKYMISGASKSMLANRISYWLDLKGPSFSLDGSCSSSTTCLTIAYRNIRSGYCDAAIVAGCNHCQHPVLSLNLQRAGYLCTDGKTKCFDKKGDGYVRSEAISVLFLQKSKHAKRIYTEIVHADEKYFAKRDALFLPTRNPNDIEKFLTEFYCKAGVSPSDVEYVEANSAGFRDADSNELEAIGRVFAKDDKVMIGSVKSNMGNAESASGVCSITKVCFAYNTGKISGNLHYNEPLDDVRAVRDGKIQVLTKNTPFNRSYTAVNTFSYTGLNCHVLMRGHYKSKDYTKYATSIPRLILVSGRTEPCVQRITNFLKSSVVDPEQIALLHEIFKTDISGHLARGYTIINSKENNETQCLAESIAYFPDTRGPVWFLYSGMGSQWAGMGSELMRLPTFAAAIKRCNRFLQPKNIDVVKIITDPDETIFNNILNSFVGIAAIQIGLTDVLKELGIVPDNIIGHSLGELATAYADGSLTTEETILSAYYRGLVSLETEFDKGLMAAVKMGHEEVSAVCPPEIEAACHNSAESTTISGPEDFVRSFVKDLTNRGIFAKEVQTSNIAFHSRYVAQAGPKLLSEMRKIITTPKLRGKKWISTSVLPAQWHSAATKYASAEYFTNNLLNKVYFEEASRFIPDNAIVIEIAPHGLMQAIVRKSLKNCTHVSLTKRGCENPVIFLLEATGRLYESGLNPIVEKLYPKVEYPVSTETPLLSHFVAWEHSDQWEIAQYEKESKTTMAAREVVLSVVDDDWKFLGQHQRNGVHVVLESAILVLVWETLAMYNGVYYEEMPVKFEDLKFHHVIVINKYENVRINISIQKGTNRFEVTTSSILVVSGVVKKEQVVNTQLASESKIFENDAFNKKYVYSILNQKGYFYESDLELIETLNLSENKAKLKWDGEWIKLLDAFFLLNLLVRNHQGQSVLKFIRKMTIHPKNHDNRIQKELYYDVDIDKRIFVTVRSKDVSLTGVIFEEKPIKILESLNTQPSNVDSHEEIEVVYIGLHEFDQIKLLKKITNIKEILLMDFSGFKRNGQRVMGIMLQLDPSISGLVAANFDLLWQIPYKWSFEDAATVILPYTQAYYCLIIKGQINDKRSIFKSKGTRNPNVFVLDGENAFGQAAISVSLECSCSVYTTVSSNFKKRLLMKLFPQLQAVNIIISTNEDFYTKLVHNTENELCDFVISNASGIMREYAMKCVAHSGIFLDTSEHDMKDNSDFGMYFLKGARSYVSVQLSNLFAEKNKMERQIIQKLVQGDIEKGIIKPFVRTIFHENETEDMILRKVGNEKAERFLIKIDKVPTNQEGSYKKKNLHVINNTHSCDFTSRKTNLNKLKENLQFMVPGNVFAKENILRDSHNVNEKKITKSGGATGLSAFYDFIDKDEYAAIDPVVIMPTLLNKVPSQADGEINPDESFLMMIPGFEGHNRIFKFISEKLKIQALTLQMGPDLLENNAADIAKIMFSHIRKIFKFKSKFYLLGYSFGVTVALELAALIENEGHTGIVICLDSSPDVLKMQIDAYLGNITNNQLQTNVIHHIYRLMSGRNPDELENHLDEIEHFSEKVEICLKKLKKIVSFSHEYIRLNVVSAYKRILSAKSYTPDILLNSEIVIIKGIAHPNTGNIPEDYNLYKYTKKPVKVFNIMSDHASVPENFEIPNIVNRMLDPEHIADFKNSNLCERYTKYGSKFI